MGSPESSVSSMPEVLTGPRYYTLEQQLAMFEALVEAKCARWTMGTCPTRPDDGREPCAVCSVLLDLGYEPFRVSDGGLESWRKKA